MVSLTDTALKTLISLQLIAPQDTNSKQPINPGWAIQAANCIDKKPIRPLYEYYIAINLRRNNILFDAYRHYLHKQNGMWTTQSVRTNNRHHVLTSGHDPPQTTHGIM